MQKTINTYRKYENTLQNKKRITKQKKKKSYYVNWYLTNKLMN